MKETVFCMQNIGLPQSKHSDIVGISYWCSKGICIPQSKHSKIVGISYWFSKGISIAQYKHNKMVGVPQSKHRTLSDVSEIQPYRSQNPAI